MTALLRPLVALGLLCAAAPQEVRIRKPPAQADLRRSKLDPGDASEVDLATLANDVGEYDKKHVKTQGKLESVVSANAGNAEFHVLSLGHAHVLVVPGYGFAREQLQQLIGSEVLARGIVRMLRAKAFRSDGKDLDLVENPELPPLPGAGPDLPRVSLTLLGVSRAGAPEETATGMALAKQILADPERFAGKPIKIVGQFRGRNLFGDLPEASQRGAADWVIKEDDLALWVTERAPKGKGFTLDPGYKGDTARWLEVEGKPEVLNGIVYLRASSVALAQRRKEEEH